MSRSAAMSQCGRRRQVAPPAGASAPTSPSSGCSTGSSSPQVRTVTFASSPPTGTSGSAGFGMRRRRSSISASTVASSASIASIRSPASTEAAFSSATSGPSGFAPPLIASPICLLAALRSALSASPSPRSVRRRGVQLQHPVDDRRVLALVDRAPPDRVGVVAEPLQPDAHAGTCPEADSGADR